MGDYQLVKSDGTTLTTSRGFTGTGVATYPNGDTYDGGFKDGFKCGPGKYTSASTFDVFEGFYEIVDGPEGKPVSKRTSYVDGKPTHLCRVTYGEGGKGGFFHGYMLNDKRHGEGTQKYANGDVYSGMWKEGKKDGVGTYVFNTTKYKFVGDWVQGQMQEGRWVLTNGAYFSGVFSANKPAGDGTWTMANKDVIDGDYSRRVIPVKNLDQTLGTSIELTWSTAAIAKGA